MKLTICIFAGVLMASLIGCGDQGTSCCATYKTPVIIDWERELNSTKKATMSNSERIDKVAKEVEAIKARSIPSKSKAKKSQITTVSYRPKQDGSQTRSAVVEVNNTIEPYSAPQTIDPNAVEYSSTPQTFSSEPAYSSAPVRTYSTGQKTYGAPQQTDVRTETRTRRVAKTVYEEVPYEVKVPVLTRQVYETQVEEYQVPVQVAKTVMKTEQRTRTVMVPKTETYSVNVPSTVMETKYETRTRSKRVPVGSEEVAAEPQSFASAAPTLPSPPQAYSEPPISYQAERMTPVADCVGCQQQPFSSAPSNVYSAPADTFSSPDPKPKVERNGLFSRDRKPVRSTISSQPVKTFRASRGGEGIAAPK